jgi:hypothetical protein
MSFLKDKEWDQMDWLNRAVEPYIFSFNLELAKIPSEFVLKYSDVIGFVKDNYEIRLSAVVNRVMTKSGVNKEGISMLDLLGIDKIFEFRLESDTELDLDQEIIKGGITLVKKIESLNDDMIRELLPTLVMNILRISGSRANASTVNEVMDILDCKEARSSSSVRKKASALTDHVYNIYKDNTWNIRNVDLAIKMLYWIKGYCENADRCSLANLSKLKCMTHNGHPIYSMEEIK